jgi:hypothetical protein
LRIKGSKGAREVAATLSGLGPFFCTQGSIASRRNPGLNDATPLALERETLGVGMVLGLEREHGGQIDSESTPGKGTVFRVWLPLMERAPRLLGHGSGQGGEKILTTEGTEDTEGERGWGEKEFNHGFHGWHGWGEAMILTQRRKGAKARRLGYGVLRLGSSAFIVRANTKSDRLKAELHTFSLCAFGSSPLCVEFASLGQRLLTSSPTEEFR